MLHSMAWSQLLLPKFPIGSAVAPCTFSMNFPSAMASGNPKVCLDCGMEDSFTNSLPASSCQHLAATGDAIGGHLVLRLGSRIVPYDMQLGTL